MKFDVEIAQELVDAGYSSRKIAKKFGIHQSAICRAIHRGVLLNDYFPFDEETDRTHLVQNFEWLWEEDKLEEICEIAYADGFSNITEILDGEDFYAVGRYVREKYGNLRKYLINKDRAMLRHFIFADCQKCGETKNILQFSRSKTDVFGIRTVECNQCTAARVKAYREISEGYADSCRERVRAYQKTEKGKISSKVSSQNRRAFEKSLPNTLTAAQVVQMLERFNGCALTDETGDLHLDHIIPLCVGHGGTTYANMIPLSSTLNLSKNDGNLFEWFESSKKRFGLSQRKFDELIAYIAKLNDMTTVEYRDYVYWCHENPRSVDELVLIKEAN